MTKNLQILKLTALIVAFLQLNCIRAQVPVEWKNKIGCSSSENSLTKTANGNNYNAGASSANVLPSGVDGWAEFTVTQLGQKFAFGFSQVDNNTNLNTIEFAIETNTNNKLKIYSSGVLQGTFGNYKIGDKIRIERIGEKINFYNTKILLKTLPLLYKTNSFIIDASINTQGASINNAISSFITPLTINPVVTDVNSITGQLGSISLNITGGKSPYTVSWFSPYTNINYPYIESIISNLEIGSYSAKISDDAGSSLVTNFSVYNKINWRDSIGVVVTDSSLIKVTDIDSWLDAGAYSIQELLADESGKLVHKITSLKSKYAIGIHNTSLPKTSYDYKGMEYSYVISNKKLLIYKKKKLLIRLSSDLVIGDELTIEKNKTDIVFYYNGIKILGEPQITPYGICAQVSLFKANTELKNIRTTFVRPLRILFAQQDVNCIKGKGGILTVNPIGGSGAYFYSFDGSSFGEQNIFKDLKAGSYILKVKDKTRRETTTTVTIENCPIWNDSYTGASVNTNGDIVKNGEGDRWNTSLNTNEPFEFAEKANWVSFKVPDTLSVFMLGFRSIDLDSTAQTTNYKLLIENSIATVIETDNDGFYNKRQINHLTKGMGFKVQLTKEGIEYYIRDNSISPYVLTYTSKLFSTAKLIIESSLYKSGSKIEAVRVSDYGNTTYPSTQ